MLIQTKWSSKGPPASLRAKIIKANIKNNLVCVVSISRCRFRSVHNTLHSYGEKTQKFAKKSLEKFWQFCQVGVSLVYGSGERGGRKVCSIMLHQMMLQTKPIRGSSSPTSTTINSLTRSKIAIILTHTLADGPCVY